MRILNLIPNTLKRYDWGLQLFRNEIAKQHDVICYGPGHGEYRKYGLHVPDIIKEYGSINVILVSNFKYCSQYTGMHKVDTAIKVCMVGDYYGGNCFAYNNFINRNNIDLVTMQYPGLMENMKMHQISGHLSKSLRIELIPHSVDTNIYKKIKLNNEYDLMSVFTIISHIYPNRARLHASLKTMSNLKMLVADNRSLGIVHDKYIKAINQSKMFVNALDVYQLIVMKFTEIMACGAFLLTEKPNGIDALGYVDRKHLVYYDSMPDMKNKVTYYLNCEEERKKIANEGMKFVRKYHSNEYRVKQLTKILEENSC